jgi:hypothetical protein
VTVVLYNRGDSGVIYNKWWLAVVQYHARYDTACGGERWGCLIPITQYRVAELPIARGEGTTLGSIQQLPFSDIMNTH